LQILSGVFNMELVILNNNISIFN